MPRTLVVRIGDTNVALPLHAKNEVVSRAAATPVPLGAPVLLGLTTVHGRAVPLINLTHLLGLKDSAGKLSVLSDFDGEAVALPIDQALGLLDVPEWPATTELLSAPVQVGEGGERLSVRALNPQAVIDRVRTHLSRL